MARPHPNLPAARLGVLLLALPLALLIAGTAFPVRASEPGDLPRPAAGVRVVDPDEVLLPGTRHDLLAIAGAVERSSGAQLAFVVTVTDGPRPQPADAQREAMSLIDRWGVGRRDINDGIVVLVMLDGTRCHGAARIQVGRGVLVGWFGGSEAAVQRMYEETMEARLVDCVIDGAMLAAGRALAARARPVDPTAVMAAPTLSDEDLLLAAAILASGLLIGLLTVAWWWRDQRPVTLLRPSDLPGDILPPDLSPALAATLLARGFSDDAFAAALLDRAAHGQIRFWSDPRKPDAARVLLVQPHLEARSQAAGSPRASAAWARPSEPVPPLIAAESDAERRFAADLDSLFVTARGVLPAVESFRLAPARRALGSALEAELVERRLLARSRTTQRLAIVPAVVAAGVAAFGWFSSTGAGVQAAWLVGGLLAAVPLAAVALGTRPSLTRAGAQVAARLASLRATLLATLSRASDLPSAAARVRSDGIAGMGTPDRLVVWSTALGLTDELGQLLWRTAGRPGTPPTAGAAASAQEWWRPLSSVLVFQMLVSDLGSTMGGAPGDHSGLFDFIPGDFGGGISFGGGGGGGGF